nr:cleavage stimulation factor subunit 2 [Hymenolepis microstoma]
MNMQTMQNVMGKESAEKTARSIFVGNIPYEATEDKLIELFSNAGPVVSFRLVYDRESGKPKGYGFCEYANAAIASSALRNLQNIEFNGRPLRVGAAAGEQNSAEIALANPFVGPPVEQPYGDRCDPSEAPEIISRAVASLPPEQMYNLMVQMKLCIQNNPNEARTMLLHNPQLAYALLQAQVVMKIVDPKVAIAMLNRTHEQIPPLKPDANAPSSSEAAVTNVEPPRTHQSFPINGVPFPNQPPSYPPEQAGGNGIYPTPGGFQQPPPASMPGGPGGYPHMPPPPHPGGPFSQQPPPPQPQTPMGSGMPASLDQINPTIAAALMSGGANLANLPQHEQEKVNLLRQALSLPEESLAMLPEDEQRGIRILKESLRRRGNF